MVSYFALNIDVDSRHWSIALCSWTNQIDICITHFKVAMYRVSTNKSLYFLPFSAASVLTILNIRIRFQTCHKMQIIFSIYIWREPLKGKELEPINFNLPFPFPHQSMLRPYSKLLNNNNKSIYIALDDIGSSQNYTGDNFLLLTQSVPTLFPRF